MHQRSGETSGPDMPEEDRRFRRAQWRILWVTMFCYLFYYTGRQTFGFAIPGIEQELGIGKVRLGWISSAMLWCYAIGQAVNGNLGDRFGGRRMMSLGALLSCLFNWLVSFAGSLAGLMVPWAINGYAQSMGWAPGSRVLSNWWSRRERGRVYGLYVGAAGLSSVLAFTTSNLILALDLNWRWIFRLPVLLLLLGGAVYYRVARDQPSELGFTGSNNLEDGPAEGQALPFSQEETEANAWYRYRRVCSNWRFMTASLAIGFQSLARYGLLTWVPVHFLGKGWRGHSGRTWITLALPVGMALGAVSSGWLSDRVFGSNRSRVIFLFMIAASPGLYRHVPVAVSLLLVHGSAGPLRVLHLRSPVGVLGPVSGSVGDPLRRHGHGSDEHACLSAGGTGRALHRLDDPTKR